MEWETVIGLEVHVQLNTKSKIFCNCSTKFGAQANTQVCPVCLALPGALPVFNKEVLGKAIRAGLALDCDIRKYSRFDRKNYFYPDLPKAYQITQYEYPICENGFVEITKEDGSRKKLNLTRIHIEEDAGKLIHAADKSVNNSFVNLNRAGTPLVEVVSEPELSSSEEAYLFLQELKSVMKYVGVSDVNMEEGSLRCDANISVRPKGQKELGIRAEIKNLNSFKAVRAAIEFEVDRHIEILLEGGRIAQETRLWDKETQQTFTMRSKEEEMDYRYFPEPDLIPVVLDDATIESYRKELPELPRAKKERYIKELSLSAYDAKVLTAEPETALYFEQALLAYKKNDKKSELKKIAKQIANWLATEILGYINKNTISLSEFSQLLSPDSLAELVFSVQSGSISGKMAKKVFEEMTKPDGKHKSKKPSVIIEALGLKQVSDTGELEKIIEQILKDNPDPVQKYKEGQTKVIGFFVGQVMKASKGQANPGIVNKILKEKLGAL